MGWQPIETAPKCRTVLVQHEEDLYPVAAYKLTENDKWRRETEGPEDEFYGANRHCPLYREPTHWMPLPAPPEGDEE